MHKASCSLYKFGLLAFALLSLTLTAGCLSFTGDRVDQPAYGVPGSELPVKVYADMPSFTDEAGYLYVRVRNNWAIKNDTWNWTSESRILSGQVTYDAGRASAAEADSASGPNYFWWGGTTGVMSVESQEAITAAGTITVPTSETAGSYVIDYRLGDSYEEFTGGADGDDLGNAITIGDLKIALGENTPPVRAIANSDTNVIQIQLEVEVGGHVTSRTIDGLSFTPNTGGLGGADITNIRLYRDNNDDGKLQTGSDTLLDTITPANPLAFSGFTSAISGGQKGHFLVVIDYTGSASNGDWLELSIAPAGVSVQEGTLNTVVGPTVDSNRTTIWNQASVSVELGANNPSDTYQIVGASAQDVTLLQLAFTAGSVDDVDLTDLTLTFTFIDDQFEAGDVTDIRLYRDNDGDGVLDGGTDPQVGDAEAWTAGGADTTITFNNFTDNGDRTVPKNATVNFIAVADLSGTGSDTENMMVRLTGTGSVSAEDQSGTAAVVTGTFPAGGTRTDVLNDVVINFDSNGVTFSAGTADPGDSDRARGATGVVAMQTRVQAPSGQKATINDLVLWNDGTATGNTDVSSVRVYRDYGADGQVNGSDYEIASGTFNTYDPTGPGNDPDGCRIQVSGGYDVPAGNAHVLLFVLDLTTSGTAGETIELRLLDPSDCEDITGDVTVGTGGTEANLYTGPVLQEASTITLQDSTLNIAAGDNAPPAKDISASAQDVSVLQAKLAAGGASNVTVTAITFDASGTGDDRRTGAGGDLANSGVTLWNDINGNGAYDAGTDTAIDSTSNYDADNGSVTFSGLSEVINAGQTENWLLVYDLAGSAANGNTFQTQIAGPSSVTCSGTVTVSGSAVSSVLTVGTTGTVTFTAGAGNPGDANVSDGTSGLVCLHLVATANDIEDIDIEGMTLTQAGTAVNADVNGTSIELYHDVNGDGALDGGDVQKGSAVADLAAMTFAFGGADTVTVSAGDSERFLLVLDVDSIPPATAGNTVKIELDEAGDVTAYRGGTSTDAKKIGAPEGGTLTIVNAATLSVSEGANTPGAGSIQANEQDVAMLQINLAAAGDNVTVTAIDIKASGSGDDRNASAGGDLANNGVHLYVDANDNGTYESGTDLPQLGSSGNYNANNGTISFTSLSRTINSGTNENWLVVQDWRDPGTASDGETFQAILQDPATDITAGTVTPSGSTVTGGLRTITTVTAITWNGSVSNAFGLAGNYDENAGPGPSIDVTIPASASVSPSVGGDGQTDDISVGAGSTLSVNAGKSLTVHGDMSVSGTLGIGSGASLSLSSGTTLTMNAGSTLQIADGTTLSVPSNAAFSANGSGWSAGQYIHVTSPAAGEYAKLDLAGDVDLDYVRFDRPADLGLTLSGSGGATVSASNVKMYGVDTAGTARCLLISGSDWYQYTFDGWGFEDPGASGGEKSVRIELGENDAVQFENYVTSGEGLSWLYEDSTDEDRGENGSSGRVNWLATAATVTEFSARPGPEGVELSWRTLTEQGNAGFELYRCALGRGGGVGKAEGIPRFRASAPDERWQRVTPVPLAGASGSVVPQAYEYLDRTAEPGRVYAYALVDVNAAVRRACSHAPVQVRVPGVEAAGAALLWIGAANRLADTLPGPFASRVILGPEMRRGAGYALLALLSPEGADAGVQLVAHRGVAARAPANGAGWPVLDDASRGRRDALLRVRNDARAARSGRSRTLRTASARKAPASWLHRAVGRALDALRTSGLARSVGALAAAHAPASVAEALEQALTDARPDPSAGPGALADAPAAGPEADAPVFRLTPPDTAAGDPDAGEGWQALLADSDRPARRVDGRGPAASSEPLTPTIPATAATAPPMHRSRGLAHLKRDPDYDRDSRERVKRERTIPLRIVGPMARIETGAEGLYRLDGSALADMGFAAERRFRLLRQGAEHPVWVLPASHALGRDLCFYAPAYKSAYSRTNVFWLVQVNRPARPAPQERPADRLGTLAEDYEAVSRYEEDTYYRMTLLSSAGDEDHWFCSKILFGGRSVDIPLTCTAVQAGAGATVRVMLRSYAQTSPSSHIRVLVNGTEVGEFSWDKARRYLAEAGIPAGVLQDGANTIRLESFGDTPAVREADFIDWAEVRYRRRFVAENGALQARVDTQTGSVRINEVPSADVVVADVTRVSAPERLTRLDVTEAGSAYEVAFAATNGHTYAATATDWLRQPEAVDLVDPPRSLEDVDCEVLIVAAEDLAEAAAAYAEYHESQGRDTEVFTVSEAMDTAYHGLYDPAAIERLARRSGAQYLLLLGDMTYDYFGVYRDERLVTVPAPYVTVRDFQCVSDYAYALARTVNGRPQVAVGRIPARTHAQALGVLEKIRARGNAPAPAYDMLLAAGQGDVQFRAGCEAAAGLATGAVRKAYVPELGGSQARAELLSGWNAGSSLVYYAGHGSLHQWGMSKLLSAGDVANLSAQPAAPIVIQLDCLSSAVHLHQPGGYGCLAEALILTKGRGASAVVGSLAFSAAGGQSQLGLAMIRELKKGHPVGQAFRRAQGELVDANGSPEVLQSFILLGDPAAR